MLGLQVQPFGNDERRLSDLESLFTCEPRAAFPCEPRQAMHTHHAFGVSTLRPENSGPHMAGEVSLRYFWWTHKGSNLGPLPCEGNALPLSYASGILSGATDARRSAPDRAVRVVRGRDLRSAGRCCQAAGVNSSPWQEIAFYQNPHLSKRIKVIWGVQSPLRK